MDASILFVFINAHASGRRGNCRDIMCMAMSVEGGCGEAEGRLAGKKQTRLLEAAV